ncbi:hypothetical protein FRC09_008132 [Ceratobasidium sp. 395]|nr:hypothetical protein FRC09_008132 [Ceratobasidium sp. 395]
MRVKSEQKVFTYISSDDEDVKPVPSTHENAVSDHPHPPSPHAIPQDAIASPGVAMPPTTPAVKRPREDSIDAADRAPSSGSAPLCKKPTIASLPQEPAVASPPEVLAPASPPNVPMSPPEMPDPASPPQGSAPPSPLEESTSVEPRRISRVQYLTHIRGWTMIEGPYEGPLGPNNEPRERTPGVSRVRQLNLPYAVKLVCAECGDPLGAGGRPFWVMDCGHMLDDACYILSSWSPIPSSLRAPQLGSWGCRAAEGCTSSHFTEYVAGGWIPYGRKGGVNVHLEVGTDVNE